MEYELIGFKVFADNEENIKGYQLFFAKDPKFNSSNEHGKVVKTFYVFPNQLEGVALNIGSLYRVFSAYDSQSKRELFAGVYQLLG